MAFPEYGIVLQERHRALTLPCSLPAGFIHHPRFRPYPPYSFASSLLLLLQADTGVSFQQSLDPPGWGSLSPQPQPCKPAPGGLHAQWWLGPHHHVLSCSCIHLGWPRGFLSQHFTCPEEIITLHLH